ncbi:MAG: VWA domain-containing protein, partial [Candidatus Micrarchaeia archaeon]
MQDNGHRGVFFSVDALFALFAVLSLITMLSLLSFDSTSPEMSMLAMHSQSGDAIDALAKTSLGDISHEPIARHLYSQNLFSARDKNKTLLDIIGTLWATNDTQNITLSSNVSRLLEPMLPANASWAFLIDNDTVYNSSPMGEGRFVTGVSRRMASGYKLSEPVIGYVSRAFLSTLRGRQAAAYSFFGGFVGQGNLTTYVRDMPGNSTIQDLYVELNLGSDAELYVNGDYCASLIKSPGIFTVDNWTLPSCIGSIVPGNDNAFTLLFTGANQSLHYVGGGFIKVIYDTDQMAAPVTSTMRYHFPGIDGVINLYDSFYVPGNISSMTAHMHFYSNQQAFLNLGNTRVMTANGNDSVQIIEISNAQLDGFLDYHNFSSMTVPLRMGIFANDTGDANMSNADVILITDVSGSMNWRIGYDDSQSGVQRACDNPDLFQPDTQRLALAKCVDKEFIDIVLNTTGPRIGLVSFSNNANTYESLTNNGAYLKGRVDQYSAGGGTCICCAINRAYNILNSQSYEGRRKYIVVMTDGIASFRCANVGGWTTDDSPTFYTLYGTKMTSDLGQAVGSSGRIVRRSGGNWNTQSSPTSSTLYGVDFSNSSYGFSVGYSGRIIRWSSNSWASVSSPTSSQLNGVSFASPSLAFAAGNGGTMVRWNGATWATVSSSTTSNLYAIDMYDSSLGFAVGASGRIIQWNGASWATVSSPTNQNLYGISMLSPTLGFAVGASGRIIEWDGSSWSLASSPVSDTLRAIELYNSTLGFATGSNGRILAWNGSDWDSDTSPVGNTLYGTSFSAGDLAFAVGSNGRIVRWDSAV